MKKKTVFRSLIAFLTIGFMTTSVWSSGQGKYSYDKNFDDRESVSSRGMSDVIKRSPIKKTPARSVPAAVIGEEEDDNYDESVSTLDYDNAPASLLDNPDIKKYIKRLFLEINPDNYTELASYATSFITKGMFSRFDEGVCIKWQRSVGFENEIFSSLLISLKSIKKLKVSVDGDTSDTNFTDLIADSVQGFKLLEELDFSGCSFTDEEMRAIIESTASRQLIKINVTGNRITADILPDIRERFKKLKSLKSDVTDESLVEESKTDLKRGHLEKRIVQPAQREGLPLARTGQLDLKEADLLGNSPSSDQKRISRIADAQAKAAKIVEDAEEEAIIEDAKATAKKIKAAADARRIAEVNAEADTKRLAEAKSESEVKGLEKNLGTSTILGTSGAGGGGVVGAVASPLKLVGIIAASSRLSIPECAVGYEAIYERFLRGVLIYKPNKGNDVGRIELPILDFLTRGQNPLESTFDLSRCGDAGQYLSISTGYRREATKSVNATKWEVFITPRFLIEAHKDTTAAHYAAIHNASWTAPFAVIQDYGGWSDINWYWYNTTISEQELNTQNLYGIYHKDSKLLPTTQHPMEQVSTRMAG